MTDTNQAELIERIARAIVEAGYNPATAHAIAGVTRPFLTAEREAGRVEGARAMKLRAVQTAHAYGLENLRTGLGLEPLKALDPAEIVKGIGNG